ncbi:MAG: sulfur carrier protein ThiS [Acidimicrobiales bacterium]
MVSYLLRGDGAASECESRAIGRVEGAPEGVQVEGAPVEGVQVEGAPVEGVRARGMAVAVNEELVPRSAWHARLLSEDDRVDVLAPAQGG